MNKIWYGLWDAWENLFVAVCNVDFIVGKYCKNAQVTFLALGKCL